MGFKMRALGVHLLTVWETTLVYSSLLLERLLEPELTVGEGGLEGHSGGREGYQPRDHLPALGCHPDDGAAGPVRTCHPDQPGGQGPQGRRGGARLGRGRRGEGLEGEGRAGHLDRQLLPRVHRRDRNEVVVVGLELGRVGRSVAVQGVDAGGRGAGGEQAEGRALAAAQTLVPDVQLVQAQAVIVGVVEV